MWHREPCAKEVENQFQYMSRCKCSWWNGRMVAITDHLLCYPFGFPYTSPTPETAARGVGSSSAPFVGRNHKRPHHPFPVSLRRRMSRSALVRGESSNGLSSKGMRLDLFRRKPISRNAPVAFGVQERILASAGTRRDCFLHCRCPWREGMAFSRKASKQKRGEVGLRVCYPKGNDGILKVSVAPSKYCPVIFLGV